MPLSRTPRAPLLLAVFLPLLLGASALAWRAEQRAAALADDQIDQVQAVLRAARYEEIKNVVRVAHRALVNVQQRDMTEVGQARAQSLLTHMDADNDNYLFVYDLQCVSIVHPRLPGLVGEPQCGITDRAGTPVILKLLEVAKNGGGYFEYLWHRPSTGRDERKVGYVELDPNWGWMIGTGLYLDRLEQTELVIRRTHQQGVSTTRHDAALILLASALVAALAVWAVLRAYRTPPPGAPAVGL